MADPSLRQSPLAALGLRAQPEAALGTIGVRLAETRFVGKINLRAAPHDAELMAALEGALGFSLPREPNTVTSQKELHALWLGPDEWLVVAPAGGEGALLQALESAAHGRHAALNDVSDARTVFALGGAHARDMLAKGCGIDLHPKAFAPGRCAQTGLARASVILHQTDETPSYDIYVDWSFAAYLWRWLEDAGREYGLEIGDPQ